MQEQTEKQRFWSGHVGAWRRSRQSRREYCAAQGLRESTFNWWVAHLRRKGSSEPIRFLPVEVIDPEPGEPVAATACGRTDLSGIVLRSPGGWTVELARGFDRETLHRALDALERR